MIDFHSHLLYGIDDGPENINESLEIIKHLSSFGFTELIPTPHKFHRLFDPQESDVVQRIFSLKRSIVKRFSFEYNCSVEKIKLIKNHHEISQAFSGEKIILIEFANAMTGKSEIEKNIQALNLLGFIPLIAHIERYLKKDEFWIELKKKYKVFYQGTIRTLAKPSFNVKKKQLIRMMENNMIDNLATDIHKISQLVKVEKGLDYFYKTFSDLKRDFFSDDFKISDI